MAQLFCRLCLIKTNEYFTINEDFRNKISKYLSVQVSENVLICKDCTQNIESFHFFYQKIQEKQSQQLSDVRFIILVKDKTEIELEEVEEPHQVTFIDIPESSANEENSPEQEAKETEEKSQVVDTPKAQSNLEGFPKELIGKEGRLVVKGKELSKLIAKFYKLECSLCSVKKKFRKFSAMISHFKNEHSEKGFVTCCGLKIVKLRQIAMHMARHIQPEAFKCPLCSKLLTCPKILQFHIQNHLPEHERSLPCPEKNCNRRFSYQSALLTHSITHLPEEERSMFNCCGKVFSTSSRLNSHVNAVHSKNTTRKEFQCEQCSKVFFCKSNLSYHLTTHKNFEFQVQCKVCKKWLKNKICLRKHIMTIHSEVRHFCDECEYSAVNKQCLINHKKIQHSDTKPFECDVCSKTFKLKNTLKNHINAQHSGLKKYSCEFCARSFFSSGNYYSHRKKMHPQELKEKLEKKALNEQKERQEILKKRSKTQ